ncbi:PRC-barrel domain-containing protein [Granulicoccus sp. GXG6511]|uniref:PRC-barrel domain-containing protein n=1 Tax=Granulicoccus sp. GXG6511 TaxID=3381351 RepID=UPI003D7D0499
MQNLSADDLHRATVYDRDGQKVGRVQQVYLDDDSGRPSWVTVNTGFFGTNESLIPLEGAQINDDVLQVPFDKAVIKDAPHFDPGHHLDERDEDSLYDYYGIGAAGQDHDDRTRADRVMGHDDRDLHDRDGRDDRGDLHDRDLRDDRGDVRDDRADLRDRSDDTGRGTAAAGTAAGVGGLAAAAAGSRDRGDHRDRDRNDLRDDVRDRDRNDLRDDVRDRGDVLDRDRGGNQGLTDRGTGLGQDRDYDASAGAGAGAGDDDPERDLLERERDLLQRERDLLDKDRQFMERDQQRSGRPRLRRHDGGSDRPLA